MRKNNFLPCAQTTYFSGIDCVIHYGDPSFECGHLKEAKVGLADMVKVHDGVFPLEFLAGLQTGTLVRDVAGVHHSVGADALREEGEERMENACKENKQINK